MAVKPFITAESIAKRNAELAAEIKAGGYDDLLVVSILASAFVFTADLVRELDKIDVSCEVHFISVIARIGVANHFSFPQQDLIKGRNVLLIDDAVGTGYTLLDAQKLLIALGAFSVATCAILDVPEKRRVQLTIDHVGFTCPDHYFVGYGMDSDSRAYRGLPYIGICDDEDDAAYHERMASLPPALVRL